MSLFRCFVSLLSWPCGICCVALVLKGLLAYILLMLMKSLSFAPKIMRSPICTHRYLVARAEEGEALVMQMDAIANEVCDIQHEARHGFQVRTTPTHTQQKHRFGVNLTVHAAFASDSAAFG